MCRSAASPPRMRAVWAGRRFVSRMRGAPNFVCKKAQTKSAPPRPAGRRPVGVPETIRLCPARTTAPEGADAGITSTGPPGIKWKGSQP